MHFQYLEPLATRRPRATLCLRGALASADQLGELLERVAPRAPQPIEHDAFGRRARRARPLAKQNSRFAVIVAARAHAVDRHVDRETARYEVAHGLENANVAFHPDHD